MNTTTTMMIADNYLRNLREGSEIAKAVDQATQVLWDTLRSHYGINPNMMSSDVLDLEVEMYRRCRELITHVYT